MASKFGAVWAIDIGNNSLKALHLSAESGVVEVIGFDNIQHGKILTGSGVGAAERDELIALSFRRFVSQNDFGKDEVVVSVPSQNSFARFVNLPPVEPKRIPEIVRFEAVQQIPFDINSVQWDWQLMTETDSPETKVGIFAIKNEVVNSALEHFGRENVQVGYVQMAPMALYNYVLYDRPDLFAPAGSKEGQAVVVLNIGAENTDLVVCTGSTVWQRCILIGGNAFTRAIADTFKLNFQKAEKLKRTAPMSKYARQIFQAMKPVFTDLASEIQRSLGFYNSSNPNTKLSRIIALGGGTKLRGLLKYLQQSVQIPIERPESFKRLTISSDVSAAKFHESVCDFGIVYGLALQALGLARIESNLLPRTIARSMAWAGKARYFTAAACILLLVSVLSFARTFFDKANYTAKGDIRQEISRRIEEAGLASRNLKAEKTKGSGYEALIQKEFDPFKYRDVIPRLHETIISRLPNEENTKEPRQKKLYKDFADGNVEAVMEVRRKERKQIFVTSMSVYFVDDVNSVKFGDVKSMMERRSRVALEERYQEQYAMGYKEMERMYKGLSKEELKRELIARGLIRDPAKDKKVKEKAGFVVTMVGYSPYENILRLMDPPGVEDEPDRWGFVTRLEHLGDVNSPFELYKRREVEHFKLQTGELGSDAKTWASPVVGRILQALGMAGSSEQRESPTPRKNIVLRDPMTKEVVGKVAERDEDGKVKTDRAGNVVYKANDHWFVLNAKLIWKEAPKKARSTLPSWVLRLTGESG